MNSMCGYLTKGAEKTLEKCRIPSPTYLKNYTGDTQYEYKKEQITPKNEPPADG